MNRPLNICSSGGLGIFAEVLKAFEIAATDAGYLVASSDLCGREDHINIYFVGHGGFLREPLFTFAKHSTNILYNFEQRLPSGWERFDYVFNIFKHIPNVKTNSGHPSIYCPLGYSRSFDSDLEPIEETIDVFHIGGLEKGHKEEMGKCYGNIITSIKCWGADRDLLIVKSKINLIVRAEPIYYLPTLRFLLIACKRKFILCEAHTRPYSINEDLVLTGFDIPSDIKYWIDAGYSARNEIAMQTYDELKTTHQYENSVTNALMKITQ